MAVGAAVDDGAVVGEEVGVVEGVDEGIWVCVAVPVEEGCGVPVGDGECVVVGFVVTVGVAV